MHLPAGSATANTAPLKINSGTVLTTPEAGAIEFDGTNLFYTTNTPTRMTISTGGAGANTALSNLASTSVNTDIIPNANNTWSLGNNSNGWSSVVSQQVITGILSSSGDLSIGAGTSSNSITVTPGTFIAGVVAPYSTEVNSTPYNVDVTSDNVIFSNTGAASTINLPVAPPDGFTVIIKDTSGTAGANHITINSGAGQTFQGGGTTLVISANFGGRTLVFHSTVWYILASV